MLVDGDVAVWDRRRILAYLAETYGDGPPAEGRGHCPFVGDLPVRRRRRLRAVDGPRAL